MASFDVESLFTNIPLHETVAICLHYLFKDVNVVLGLSRKLFKQFLDLAVMNSYFLFNGKFYQQIEGLGMGIPLGPTFANIFMCHHERKWLEKCPIEFCPVFYRRYIDDTFLLFKDPSHCDKFLNYLNTQHSRIRFTVEKENNGKLQFLDTVITRKNNIFESSVYRKPTFTGLGLSFFSFCPFNFKINSIKTLLSRAYRNCSNYTLLHGEFEFLRNFFTNNGYPTFLFDRYVKKFLYSIRNRKEIIPTVPKRQHYISIPYFGSQSDKLKTELIPLFQKYFTNTDFNFIFVNKFSIASFFRSKDRLPKVLLSSLIYEYSCASCASRYIGMTSRTLGSRVAEHTGVSVRTGKRLSTPPHSMIRPHAEGCHRPVSVDDFRVLTTASSPLDLRILESLYIFKTNPILNDVQSSYPLKIVNH